MWNILKIDRLCKHKLSICTIFWICIALFIVLTLIYFISPHCSHLNDYGAFIGGIASVISIVLLFITLNHQDCSFKQERFETTFFNLLETHKKLTEELTVSQIVPNDYANTIKPQIFKGRQCFLFAAIERSAICRALSADKYEGYYDESDDKCINQWYYAMDYYENEPEKLDHCEKMIAEIEKSKIRKYYNLLYQISKETYESYHEYVKNLNNKESVSSFCHQIFYYPYRFTFEVYFRSLEQLIKFICNNKPDNERGHQYMEILISQMPCNEIRFIICHALCDSNFQKVCNDMGLHDLLKENEFTMN